MRFTPGSHILGFQPVFKIKAKGRRMNNRAMKPPLALHRKTPVSGVLQKKMIYLLKSILWRIHTCIRPMRARGSPRSKKQGVGGIVQKESGCQSLQLTASRRSRLSKSAVTRPLCHGVCLRTRRAIAHLTCIWACSLGNS